MEGEETTMRADVVTAVDPVTTVDPAGGGAMGDAPWRSTMTTAVVNWDLL